MTAVGHPPGAQPERTALAWQRTVLGAVVGSIVLGFTALRVDEFVLALLAGVLTVALALAFVTGGPARALRDGRPAHAWPGLTRMVAAVIGLGVLGTAVAVSRAWAGVG